MNPVRALGAGFLKFLAATGRLTVFALTGISHCVRPPFYPRLILRQIIDIGYYSLPVVGLTTLFAGMVLALQSHTGFARFSAEGAIPSVVALSITRELSPVLAGLMIAGRIGAAMAAELGTMRVTEQVDALETLSTNPMKYLIVPRLLAGVTMLPFLVLIEAQDVISGLVKAAVFGFLVALMGCYHGFNSRGGAQGVGAATTNAVVSASILILIANYLITEMFFAQ